MKEESTKEALGQKQYPQRTLLQNRAMHLFFKHEAEELNGAGLNMRAVLQENPLEISWTPVSVKEVLWRPIMKIMLGIESTRDLDRVDMTKIWEEINRINSGLGVHVPFPSQEETLAYINSLKQQSHGLPKTKRTG